MRTIVPEQYPAIAEIIRTQENGYRPEDCVPINSQDCTDLIAEIRNLLAVRQAMVELADRMKQIHKL